MEQYQEIALKEIEKRDEYLLKRLIESEFCYNEFDELIMEKMSAIDEEMFENPKDIAAVYEMNQRLKSLLLKTNKHDRVIININTMANVASNMPMKKSEQVMLFFDLLETEMNRQLSNSVILGEKFRRFLKNSGMNLEGLKKSLIENNFADFIKIIEQNISVDLNKFALILLENAEESEKEKKRYNTLKKHYYDQNRIPSRIGMNKICKALKELGLNSANVSWIQKQLEKVVYVQERKIQKQAERQANVTESIVRRVQYIEPMSDKEWKEINQEIRNLYDVKSNVPTKSLNIKEKIRLVVLLQKISYSKDEIKGILCNIDEYARMNDFTNTNSTIENALIIKRMIQKEKQKLINIPELKDIKEIEDTLDTCDKNEREVWLDMLLEFIKEENAKQLQIMQAVYEDLHTIPITQRATWHEVLFANNKINEHPGYAILTTILKYLHKLPDDKQESWRKQARIALYRMYLENIGNYEYEIREASEIGENSRKKLK